MHERECKGYISFNRGVNELNRGVNELNRGVNELNRGVNHSVARQGCNLLRAAVTSAVTSQGCCCGNLQIHPLDLGQVDEGVVLVITLFTSLSARTGLEVMCKRQTINTTFVTLMCFWLVLVPCVENVALEQCAECAGTI